MANILRVSRITFIRRPFSKATLSLVARLSSLVMGLMFLKPEGSIIIINARRWINGTQNTT
jgi:hypothetical protein